MDYNDNFVLQELTYEEGMAEIDAFYPSPPARSPPNNTAPAELELPSAVLQPDLHDTNFLDASGDGDGDGDEFAQLMSEVDQLPDATLSAEQDNAPNQGKSMLEEQQFASDLSDPLPKDLPATPSNAQDYHASPLPNDELPDTPPCNPPLPSSGTKTDFLSEMRTEEKESDDGPPADSPPRPGPLFATGNRRSSVLEDAPSLTSRSSIPEQTTSDAVAEEDQMNVEIATESNAQEVKNAAEEVSDEADGGDTAMVVRILKRNREPDTVDGKDEMSEEGQQEKRQKLALPEEENTTEDDVPAEKIDTPEEATTSEHQKEESDSSLTDLTSHRNSSSPAKPEKSDAETNANTDSIEEENVSENEDVAPTSGEDSGTNEDQPAEEAAGGAETGTRRTTRSKSKATATATSKSTKTGKSTASKRKPKATATQPDEKAAPATTTSSAPKQDKPKTRTTPRELQELIAANVLDKYHTRTRAQEKELKTQQMELERAQEKPSAAAKKRHGGGGK